MYIERQQAGVTSGIFDVPLPLNPMRCTLVEIFNTWQEEYLTPLNPTRAFVFPTLLMMFRLLYTVLINFNEVIETVSIYERMFFAKLIAVAVGGLIVQYLQHLVWSI